MTAIHLDTSTLPSVMKTILRSSFGASIAPEVVFHLASDDPTDLHTWAAAIGGKVEEHELVEVSAGVRMACASTEADIDGLHVEVWQAWPVAAPAADAAVAR